MANQSNIEPNRKTGKADALDGDASLDPSSSIDSIDEDDKDEKVFKVKSRKKLLERRIAACFALFKNITNQDKYTEFPRFSNITDPWNILNFDKALSKIAGGKVPELADELEDEMREIELFADQHVNYGTPLPRQIANDDELRNVNSFEYLLNMAPFVSEFLRLIDSDDYDDSKKKYSAFRKVVAMKNKRYMRDYAYGNLYTQFLNEFEANIADILEIQNNADKELKGVIENMIYSIYANPNLALERSTAATMWILRRTKHTENTQKRVTSYIRKEKSRTLKLQRRSLNKVSPSRMEKRAWWHGTKAFFAGFTQLFGSFSPQMTTSQPSVRKYKYKTVVVESPKVAQSLNDAQSPKVEQDPIEYRFGTQASFLKGKARVNPLFVAFAQNLPEPEYPSQYTHIYFNFLPTHKTKFFSGTIEVPLSEQLHKLENDRLAVITLPADHGMLSAKDAENQKQAMNAATAKKLFLAIASGAENCDGVSNFAELSRDFRISDNVKKALYGPGEGNDAYNKGNEKKLLDQWIKEAFDDLGFKEDQNLTEAQLQAVYFHFLKYRLTNHIMQILKPKSFNMSCKDAIDRGGVASAYYNLIKSIERNNPMTEAEFYTALHGAPTLVKGRGMNHHVKLIWNAIDSYVNENGEKTNANGEKIIPPWLIKWRDDNALKGSQRFWLNLLDEFIKEVEDKAKTEIKPDDKKQPAHYYSFELFGLVKKRVEHADIISAANKLKELIQNKKIEAFTPGELEALKIYKLNTMCNKMIDYKLLAIDFKGASKPSKTEDYNRDRFAGFQR